MPLNGELAKTRIVAALEFQKCSSRVGNESVGMSGSK